MKVGEGRKMLVAGEDLYERAICVKVDSSFYLAQAGDEKGDVYLCIEVIKEGDKIVVHIYDKDVNLKGVTMRGPVKILLKDYRENFRGGSDEK